MKRLDANKRRPNGGRPTAAAWTARRSRRLGLDPPNAAPQCCRRRRRKAGSAGVSWTQTRAFPSTSSPAAVDQRLAVGERIATQVAGDIVRTVVPVPVQPVVLQRQVEQHGVGQRRSVAQECRIVRNMLEHIAQEHDIEAGAGERAEVAAAKLDVRKASLRGPHVGLRDVDADAAPARPDRHRRDQLAGRTPDLEHAADRLRSRQHAQQVRQLEQADLEIDLRLRVRTVAATRDVIRMCVDTARGNRPRAVRGHRHVVRGVDHQGARWRLHAPRRRPGPAVHR
jgi:hypothetical protein